MPEEEKGSWFGNLIGNQIGGTAEVIVSFIYDSAFNLLLYIQTNIRGTIDTLIYKPLTTVFEGLLIRFEGSGIIDANDRKVLESYKQAPEPLRTIFIFAIAFYFIFAELKTTLEASLGTLRQTLNKKASPNPPDAMAVVGAMFRKPALTGEVREAMQRGGYDERDIDLMVYAQMAAYPLELIRSIYYREGKGQDWAVEKIAELGYTPDRITEIMSTWPVIPSPSDIAHFVAREAFEPESIALMGLLEEFPEEMVQWGKKQGFDEYWMQKVWISHWQQPSLLMGFEMFHRRVIDRTELEFLFKTVEIPPYWRSKLIAISYTPLTRVDVRRMYQDGAIDESIMYSSYLDHGYSPENAELMSNWTILYTKRSDINTAKRAILAAYKDRTIKRDKAKELLIRNEVKEDDAEYQLTLADYTIEKELDEGKIKLIALKYKELIIDGAQARSQLNGLNLPSVQTEFLLDKWSVEKEAKEALPSKTDLHKFLLQKIILEPVYRDQMTQLGFRDEKINWYLALANKKKGLGGNE